MNTVDSVKEWCIESLQPCSGKLLSRLSEKIIQEQVDREVLFSLCEDGETFFAKLLFDSSTNVNCAPHDSLRMPKRSPIILPLEQYSAKYVG